MREGELWRTMPSGVQIPTVTFKATYTGRGSAVEARSMETSNMTRLEYFMAGFAVSCALLSGFVIIDTASNLEQVVKEDRIRPCDVCPYREEDRGG